MKVKIREIFENINYSSIEDSDFNFYKIKITDKFKWLTLPVKIIPIKIDRTFTGLIFYDGTTGDWSYNVEEGRTSDPTIESATKADYMFYLQLSDPYYYKGQVVTPGDYSGIGWTSGTPFYYVRKQEVDYMVEVMKLQGATSTTKGYGYINWTEDNREFIIFNGYTGPPGVVGGVNRTVEDHQLLSRTMAKYLVGGTGIDGISFHGLKYYFPNISFGFYNNPTWSYQSDAMWVSDVATINNALNVAANVFCSATDLVDAIDLLMPSLYSSVNSRDFNMIRAEQNMKLCNLINEKLVEQGKSVKKIIPFVTPFYNTVATCTPYATFQYATAYSSYARVMHGITLMKYYYLPPNTVMSDSDLRYEAYDPIISNGGDGATIWLGQAYRYKQIRGRTGIGLSEDISIGLTECRKGVTGATANFTLKDTYRQAVSAWTNYTNGVCMGITGYRWWYKELPGSTAYTPPEWCPLTENQPLGSTGISSTETGEFVEIFLHDMLVRNINTFQTAWIELKNG
jgi:hypothetical protein